MEHAEINCMRNGAKVIGDWRLNRFHLYSTLEPCLVCVSAARSFRIGRIFFGAYNYNPDEVARKLLFDHFNPMGGILEKECSGVLKDFFRMRRFDESC